MRLRGAVLVSLMGLTLAACATTQTAQQTCPAGQEKLRTARLFFGRKPAAGRPPVTDAAFGRFVKEELTTRFKDGLTVLDGGAQWKGPENRDLREAAKIVLIVLPRDEDAQPRLEAVQAAYKARFAQDSVLRLTGPACVGL